MPRSALCHWLQTFVSKAHTLYSNSLRMQAQQMSASIQTHREEGKEAGDIPIGDQSVLQRRQQPLGQDFISSRCRRTEDSKHSILWAGHIKMMLPIWSTNNVINSGHRSSSSGRRVNPPSRDVSAHRDRLEPADRLRLKLFGISPKLLHMTRGVRIFGRRERCNVRDCLL